MARSLFAAEGAVRADAHPGAWIAWTTGVGGAAFLTTNPFYLLVLVAAVWFVSATCRVPGPTARSFRVFVIGGVVAMTVRTALVVFSTIDAESVAFAALEGVRLAAILVIFGAYNTVSDPYGVLRLAPRRFHEPALAAALALSLAPRTAESVVRVREAQRLRGIGTSALRSLSALAIPVLETGMEESLTLAESMDARGHGRGRRSRYRPQRWTAGSSLIAMSGLVVFGTFVWAAVEHAGGLHPATSPLEWPVVALPLVIAAAAAALPGVAAGPRRTARQTALRPEGAA